jgi:hypothetical protein
VAAWMDTPTWQLATLPSAPQYCGATPTDQRPNLGKPVSSMTHACGPMAAVIRSARRRRTGVGSHGDWLTNCCSACSSASASACGSPLASRVAKGWIDLRLPSSNKPRR